ncbi:MAG: adenylyl-sulfate kinase [Microbacterium arborescens]
MQRDTTTEVMFLGGRSGVGKTSTAAEISRMLARCDIRHAVIEGDNLDQAHPQPWREGIDLAGRNLAAMWANYRSLGYSRLVYTNTVSVMEVTPLSAALGGDVRAFAVLLTATDDAANARLMRRESGGSLREHVERSARSAAELDRAHGAGLVDAVRIDTTGRTIAEVAAEVLEQSGWLRP